MVDQDLILLLPPQRGIILKERRNPSADAHGTPLDRGKPRPHGSLMVKAIGHRLSLFSHLAPSTLIESIWKYLGAISVGIPNFLPESPPNRDTMSRFMSR